MMIPQKRTGIMGGTFNPIHNGHLLLAKQAREYCRLDEVLFMPSGNSYMKDASEILSGSIRVTMTELAIKNNPYFTLSTMEVERDGPTYTCDTLCELKKIHNDVLYYLIIGEDTLFSMEYWKNYEEILSGCILTVASRGDRSRQQMEEKASELINKHHAQIVLLPERRWDISSTEIRRRIAKGEPITDMVPEKVSSYIQLHQLYQSHDSDMH